MNLRTRPARRRTTCLDVIDAPPHMVAEIVRGVLSLQPRPRPRHAQAASVIGFEVGVPYDRGRGGPCGWRILIEPELHLGDDVPVPDLAGWRRERLPRLPETVGITVAPDWVCQVLAPSTRALDLAGKRAIYGEQGVACLRLVDPLAQTLEAFALHDGARVLIFAHRGAAEVRVAPFEAMALEMGALWAE